MLTFPQFLSDAAEMARSEGEPGLADAIIVNGRQFDLVVAASDEMLERVDSLKLRQFLMAFEAIVQRHRGCERIELDEDLFAGRTFGQVYEELCRRYGNPPSSVSHPVAA